jgi:uncharacterized tellurite resistance protein B-like protein
VIVLLCAGFVVAGPLALAVAFSRKARPNPKLDTPEILVSLPRAHGAASSRVEPRGDQGLKTRSSVDQDFDGMSRATVRAVAPKPEGEAASSSRPGQPWSWIRPSETVEIAGVRVAEGMLYVGSGLTSGSGYGVEPALIDGGLPVAWTNPDFRAEEMSYWPSYDTIPPRSRAGYLRWLEGGRRDPDIGIGHVFLYFYGLERRVLVDASLDPLARAEVPVLLAEVQRLLTVYGSRSSSFQHYATSFIAYARLSLGFGVDESAVAAADKARIGGFVPSLPLPLRLAIGRRLQAGQPLPPALALRWVTAHPEGGGLRTAALRCGALFEACFSLRYHELFPEGGLLVSAPDQSVTVDYRPATPSLRQTRSLSTGVPDIAHLSAPVKRLAEIVEEVTVELDPYSRWLGRNQGVESNLPGYALLPPEFLDLVEDRRLQRFRAWALEQHGRIVPTPVLSAHWFGEANSEWRKQDAVACGALLESIGTGIEPDARLGGKRPDQAGQVVLFELGSVPENPTGAAFQSALLALHLASSVTVADGDVEPAAQRRLREHIEGALGLSHGDRIRLAAHLEWLLVAHPGTAGLAKRLAQVAEAERVRLGDLLVTLAIADGSVTAAEMKLLGRTFKLLGLEESGVHDRIHQALAAGHRSRDSMEPVTVIPAEPTPLYAVPRKPSEARLLTPTTPAPVALDAGRIASMVRETEQTTAFLASIFEDESVFDPADEVAVSPESESPRARWQQIGLSDAHRDLLERLGRSDSWSRADFESAARAVGLLPDGALETLNEAAFELCGAPLLDPGEPLELDTTILQEMLA